MTRSDSADRVHSHTLEREACASDRSPMWVAFAAVLLALTFAPPLARSAPAGPDWRPTSARVVWVRDSLVVVAADSGVLVRGTPISIQRGKRPLAVARVDRLLEPGLWSARRLEGSLAAEKRLDKLRVLAQPVQPAPGPALRVGLPSPARTQLLFACTAPRWIAPSGEPYPADSLGRGLVRLVRGLRELGPETLVVRLFADAADQEIALERGELDAAVFWPGELSSRMRTDARWREPLRVRRRQGALACVGPDSLSPDPDALEKLQREVFAGDLEPIPLAVSPGAPPARLARLEPDPALPGAAALSRALTSPGGGGPALRLTYLPEVDAMAPPSSARVVFALRCVVLASPALRQGWPVNEGAQELANLLQCGVPR